MITKLVQNLEDLFREICTQPATKEQLCERLNAGHSHMSERLAELLERHLVERDHMDRYYPSPCYVPGCKAPICCLQHRCCKAHAAAFQAFAGRAPGPMEGRHQLRSLTVALGLVKDGALEVPEPSTEIPSWQLRVRDTIRGCAIPGSPEQIAAAAGCSPSSIAAAISALRKAGYPILQEDGKLRMGFYRQAGTTEAPPKPAPEPAVTLEIPAVTDATEPETAQYIVKTIAELLKVDEGSLIDEIRIINSRWDEMQSEIDSLKVESEEWRGRYNAALEEHRREIDKLCDLLSAEPEDLESALEGRLAELSEFRAERSGLYATVERQRIQIGELQRSMGKIRARLGIDEYEDIEAAIYEMALQSDERRAAIERLEERFRVRLGLDLGEPLDAGIEGLIELSNSQDRRIHSLESTLIDLRARADMADRIALKGKVIRHVDDPASPDGRIAGVVVAIDGPLLPNIGPVRVIA